MISIYTNNERGSGDWCVVKINDKTFQSGHSFSLADFVNFVQTYTLYPVEVIELTDEEISDVF